MRAPRPQHLEQPVHDILDAHPTAWAVGCTTALGAGALLLQRWFLNRRERRAELEHFRERHLSGRRSVVLREPISLCDYRARREVEQHARREAVEVEAPALSA